MTASRENDRSKWATDASMRAQDRRYIKRVMEVHFQPVVTSRDKVEVTPQIAKAVVHPPNIFWDGNYSVQPKSMRDAAALVISRHKITMEELTGHSRKARLLPARDDFVWYCRRSLRKSFPQIGKFLNRHHTSILHYERRVERRMTA